MQRQDRLGDDVDHGDGGALEAGDDVVIDVAGYEFGVDVAKREIGQVEDQVGCCIGQQTANTVGLDEVIERR